MEVKIEDDLLENFMKEFFPIKELLKVGFFTKEMKGDYKAQAERVCKFFGFKTVYEYGAKESPPFHLTYACERPKGVPFSQFIPSIYET